MVFDSLITKISDFLAQPGNQSSGSFKTLMDRMVGLVDKEMQDNQQSSGMSPVDENQIPNIDRFDEVFSGSDEE